MNVEITTDQLLARIGLLTLTNEHLAAEVSRLEAEVAALKVEGAARAASPPEGRAK